MSSFPKNVIETWLRNVETGGYTDDLYRLRYSDGEYFYEAEPWRYEPWWPEAEKTTYIMTYVVYFESCAVLNSTLSFTLNDNEFQKFRELYTELIEKRGQH